MNFPEECVRVCPLQGWVGHVTGIEKQKEGN